MSGRTHAKEVKSIAVMNEDGTGYEEIDAPAKVVVLSLSIIAGLAVIAFALMFGYDKFLEASHPQTSLPSPLARERILPPAPQIQRLPWNDLPLLRAHEQEVLTSSGKDASGHFHIPMDKAIDMMVSRMNVSPDAVPGLSTPGGQGRDFSHGLADMPPAYQHSQAVIQGEIHKDAK